MGRAGHCLRHPGRDQSERPVWLNHAQVILACESPLKHDRHHLAASRMKRIVDPDLERRTPGIVTLS
jgi:hypothetical protein